MTGYTVKIAIEDTHPPVWRRVILPEHISFYDLHQIIQILFRWKDAHLHDFTFPDSDISVCLPETSTYGDYLSEKTTLVDDYLHENRWIRYTYDFGDDWRHKIVFEKDVPDYDKRYATILKGKGDGFAEDSGGVWQDDFDDDEFDDDEFSFEVPPFSITDIAAKLEKKQFPDRKGKKQNKTMSESSTKKQNRKNEKPIEKVSAEDIWTLTDALRSLFDDILNDVEKEKKSSPKKLSSMEKSLEQLINLTENNNKDDITFYKNSSETSIATILEKLSCDDAKKYLKFLQVPFKGNLSKKKIIDIIADTLSSHPEYFLYGLTKDDIKELTDILQDKSEKLDKMPDVNCLLRGMALGLLDCVYTEKKDEKSVLITFAKEAEKILTAFKPAEINNEYYRIHEVSVNIGLLLMPFGILDMDTLYERYCFYWGNSLTKEELSRIACFHCVLCKNLQFCENNSKQAYIAINGINMPDALADIAFFAKDLPYKMTDLEELRQWNNGFCVVYESWGDYEMYLTKNIHDFSVKISDFLEEAFYDVLAGHSASYLIKKTMKVTKPTTPSNYFDLWLVIMNVVMETGIPGLKGYSREEYLEIRKYLPGKYSPVDEDIVKPDITAKTHLYEMPSEIQQRLHNSLFSEPADIKTELEAIMSELKVRNKEILEMLSSVNDVQRLNDIISSESPNYDDIDEYDYDMLSPLERYPKQEPYRRESAKIGRNDPCPCGSGKKYKHCCGRNK